MLFSIPCSLFPTPYSLFLKSVGDAEGYAGANVQVDLAGSRGTIGVADDFVQQRVVDVATRVQDAGVHIELLLGEGHDADGIDLGCGNVEDRGSRFSSPINILQGGQNRGRRDVLGLL